MNTNDYVAIFQAYIICLLAFIVGAAAIVQHPEWFN
jgi:hypothetical protein